MTIQAPLTTKLRDVIVPGLTRRKLIRVKDTTIRTLKNGYLYLDPAAPSVNASAKVGRSLIGDWDFNWTGDTNLSIVENDADFNGEAVFHTTTAQHYLTFPDPPNLATYTIITVLAIPQSVIDAADAFTLGSRYVLSVYDEPANVIKVGLLMFGNAGVKGWTVRPGQGDNFNVLWTTFPATKPVADTPFILAWKFDKPTETSYFYFNDGETPITSHVHVLGGDAGGGDGRYWPMSFGLGSNTASWQGDMAMMLIHDDTVEATRMTDDQRIAIMNELSAAYDV